MRDWPGLVSPEVVAARRTLGPEAAAYGNYPWARVAEIIKPDWIVARPAEIEQMRGFPALVQHYRAIEVFDVTAQLRADGEYYGQGIAFGEAVFVVYRRDGLRP
jgi:hypothetical protein